MLCQIDEPHAVIAIDELARGVLPGGSTDFNRSLAVRNLGLVWASFAAAGVRRLVLERIVQTVGDVAALRDALPDCEIVVCRVNASAATIAPRIAGREPGSAREFLTRVSPEIAACLDRLDLGGFTVDNDGDVSVTALAHRVLAQIGWPRPVS